MSDLESSRSGFDKHIETERKYIIEIPDINILKNQPGYFSSRIEQIYIVNGSGVFDGDRIRKREYPDGIRFFKTHKENINGISRIEVEGEISEEEYILLSEKIVPGTRQIKKVRYCFDYKGQVVEIDIYDFWNDTATLEVELENEESEVFIPDFVSVKEDVTGDDSYSNYSLSFVGGKNRCLNFPHLK